VCGRGAGAHGYALRDYSRVLWLCDDPGCVEQASKVYNMKTRDLNDYERKAFNEAIGHSADAIFESVMTVLWEHGAQNLNELDADKFDQLKRAATQNEKLQEAMAYFQNAFAYSLRRQLDPSQTPF
jgi:hypothetical protein